MQIASKKGNGGTALRNGNETDQLLVLQHNENLFVVRSWLSKPRRRLQFVGSCALPPTPANLEHALAPSP
eukprot:5675095-Prymnesium_polylepis.2